MIFFICILLCIVSYNKGRDDAYLRVKAMIEEIRDEARKIH